MKIKFSPMTEWAKENPPEPIKKNVPNWYKNMDLLIKDQESTAKSLNEHNSSTPYTVKKCIPVLDYLTSGYLFKFTSEVMVTEDVSEDGVHFNWRTPSKETAIDGHSHYQCPVSIRGKKRTYIKFFPFYKITTPPGYSCLFYQPDFLGEKNFTLFPGIVDTDKHEVGINFPGYIHDGVENFHIPLGHPMIAIFPFKRDDWEMELDDKIHYDQTTNFMKKRTIKFYDIYRDFFHSKKSYK